MKFSSSIISFALLSSCAFASPLSDGLEGRDLEKRDDIQVYVSSAANGGGIGKSIAITTQTQCYSLDGTDLDDHVGSISIPAGYRCRFWQSHHCNGDGTGDIAASSGKGDAIASIKGSLSSFKCYVGEYK